jgi:hypothetical protein
MGATCGKTKLDVLTQLVANQTWVSGGCCGSQTRQTKSMKYRWNKTHEAKNSSGDAVDEVLYDPFSFQDMMANVNITITNDVGNEEVFKDQPLALMITKYKAEQIVSIKRAL